VKGLSIIALSFLVLSSSLIANPILHIPQASANQIEQLPFKQLLDVPIDTSILGAQFQPIDLRVRFLYSCWAQNESVHAVRVAYIDENGLTEIESQIYDLEYCDETHIAACSIVFLIPPDMSGNEEYYVLYDDSETTPAGYPDHLTVEDTHYYYEPISGQKIDFDYYKITEDGFIVYGICQKGVLLGNGVSQMVVKLKINSTEFETVNTDQLGDFSMTYSIEGSQESTGSDWSTDITKGVMVNGNLMIRLKIECVSPEGNIRTDNIYTYYYCPSTTKRLAVNVNHDVLQTVEISGNMERDGSYASLTTGKTRSATIENMNTGEILPSLHVYSEDNIVKEYAVPSNPSSEKEEWILSTTDDIDIGKKGWLCIDDPATGKAHGLIFQSNEGFLPGKDDGLQVKSSVREVVKLPGLEADASTLLATRNAYERGESHDILLSDTINTTFNVEFITFENAGYEGVDTEANLFKNLVAHRPIFRGNISGDAEIKERYELTAYAHLAPSIPMGSILSAFTGRNVSYVYAELYRDDSLQSSGSVGRLSLSETMDLEFENTTLMQKIRLVIGLFDWRNLSLVKRIRFPDLDAGRYFIKIFRENPLFSDERQYIGFTSVDVSENVSTHIFARPEGIYRLTVADQNGNGVANVKALLVHDNITVSKIYSDRNGSIILKAPWMASSRYNLKAIYQGFLIQDDLIHLQKIGKKYVKPKEVSINLYRLEITVTDTWDLPPAVEINPTLTSHQMVELSPIFAAPSALGTYVFSNLYPAQYRLAMGYKSFSIEEDVTVPDITTRNIMFPAQFNVTVASFDNRGNTLTEGKLTVERGKHAVSAAISSTGKAIVSIPPGTYNAYVNVDGKDVGQQVIDVKGEKTVEVVTKHSSLIYSVISVIGVALSGLVSAIFLFKKKNVFAAVKVGLIALIVVALLSSWWSLEGSQSDATTSTNTRLIPAKIVTITTDGSTAGGDIGSVIPEFSLVLMLIVLLLFLVALLILIQVLVEEKHVKLGIVLGLLYIILIILCLILFQFAMSQVTQVGVGSFRGHGDLEVSIPGDLEGNKIFSCHWGPGLGFYFGILVAISLIILFIYRNKRNIVFIFNQLRNKFSRPILNRKRTTLNSVK